MVRKIRQDSPSQEQTNIPERPRQTDAINFHDLSKYFDDVLSIINLAAQRGAIAGEQLYSVGNFYKQTTVLKELFSDQDVLLSSMRSYMRNFVPPEDFEEVN